MFLRKNWKISIDYFSESCCILLSFSIMCGIIDKLCGRLPTCSLRLCRDQGTIEEEKKNGNLARLPAWQQGNPESSSPPPHVGQQPVLRWWPQPASTVKGKTDLEITSSLARHPKPPSLLKNTSVHLHRMPFSGNKLWTKIESFLYRNNFKVGAVHIFLS